VNADERWIVDAFLAECDQLKFNQPDVPLSVVERRLTLANKVLREIGDVDLECLAVRAVADAVVDLCSSPKDDRLGLGRVRGRRACLLGRLAM
jgi:hypothetical protein